MPEALKLARPAKDGAGPHRQRVWQLLWLVLGLIAAHPAFAIELQALHPPTGGDFLAAETSLTPQHLTPALSIWTCFSQDLLKLSRAGHPSLAILDHQLSLEANFSLGLGRNSALGVALPGVVAQTTELTAQAGSSELPAELQSLHPGPRSLGDLRVSLKHRLLEPRAPVNGRSRSGLALLGALSLPTGSPEDLNGAGHPTLTALLAADRRVARARVALNLGYRWVAEPWHLLNLEVDDTLILRAGASLPILQSWSLSAEVLGSTVLGTAADAFWKHTPVEVLVAGRHANTRGLSTHLGLSVGLSSGYGAPAYRLVLGLGHCARPSRDEDGDGIPDPQDRCMHLPEDLDHFEDGDGCPDPDNDGDGHPDSSDACPDQAEDPDQFEDEDGCPDPDNDGDGVLDGTDQCPVGAEDRDGFEDGDGCPDPDNDGDGVLDVDDACPNQIEDLDHFEDQDGCPEADNDGDGLSDLLDQCPDQAEILNGHRDEDGCPDQAPEQVGLTLEDDLILLEHPLQFRPGRAELEADAGTNLEPLVELLLANPDWRLHIAGYADGGGRRTHPGHLSLRRAQAVRQLLIRKGHIAPERLLAEGMSSSLLRSPRDAQPGRGQIRAIELRVLRPTPERMRPPDEAPRLERP